MKMSFKHPITKLEESGNQNTCSTSPEIFRIFEYKVLKVLPSETVTALEECFFFPQPKSMKNEYWKLVKHFILYVFYEIVLIVIEVIFVLITF